MTNEQVDEAASAVASILGPVAGPPDMIEHLKANQHDMCRRIAHAVIEAYEATDDKVLDDEAAYIRGWNACCEHVRRVAMPVNGGPE